MSQSLEKEESANQWKIEDHKSWKLSSCRNKTEKITILCKRFWIMPGLESNQNMLNTQKLVMERHWSQIKNKIKIVDGQIGNYQWRCFNCDPALFKQCTSLQIRTVYLTGDVSNLWVDENKDVQI